MRPRSCCDGRSSTNEAACAVARFVSARLSVERSLPGVLELLLIAVILLVVAVFVTAPLRRPRRQDRGADEDPRLVELDARKEAKYREIRDAEMDREAGKLSEEEWRRHDAELRREAIRILRQIDELEGTTGKRSAG
jgi:hypothetical protein